MRTLFLYGTSLPGLPDNRWVVGLPAFPGTVRGTLWRGPRNRPVLVPDPDGRPIKGMLVDVDDARLTVMDLVETGYDGPLRRISVRANLNMRSVPAEAWAWPPGTKLPRGYRKIATDDWSRMVR